MKEMANQERRNSAAVVALYPDVETTRAVAERLIRNGVPAGDLSVVVSDGKLRESLARGDALIPPAAYSGVRREGAVVGGL